MKPPPDRWLPIGDVYARVKRLLGSPDLAIPELEAALAEGKIATMERSASRSTGGRLGPSRELSAKFWQTAKLLWFASGPDVDNTEQLTDFSYHYFLRESDVERLWPIHSKPPIGDAGETPWRRNSPAGAKADYHWEQILVKAAGHLWRDGLPESFTDLCKYIETWCGDDAPGETQLKEHLRPLWNELRKADSK